MFVSRHGSGDPLLLLLHGLGATGEVWDGLVSSLAWPGSLVVPDLPGHGRSPALPRYSFGSMASALASELPRDRPVAVLGHSLGGVVGLTLASGWFGVAVRAVCGLGIKVRWSDADLAKAASLAARPARTFDTREEAMDRALKVAGLSGLLPSLAAGVASSDSWRLTLDPATFGIGAPDMPGLLAACRCPVILAAGAADPMSPRSDLRALRPDAVELAGLGHNAHVEDPKALRPILDQLANAE